MGAAEGAVGPAVVAGDRDPLCHALMRLLQAEGVPVAAVSLRRELDACEKCLGSFMVVIDWDAAPGPAARLARLIRRSSPKTRICAVRPWWAESRLEARELVDFIVNDPPRKAQIHRILAAALGAETSVVAREVRV